jgi:hypothetical protein
MNSVLQDVNPEDSTHDSSKGRRYPQAIVGETRGVESNYEAWGADYGRQFLKIGR